MPFTFEQKLELKKIAGDKAASGAALTFEQKVGLLKSAAPGGFHYNQTDPARLAGNPAAARAETRHLANKTNLGVTSPIAGEMGKGPAPMKAPASPAGPSAAASGMKAPSSRSRSGGGDAVSTVKNTAQAAGGALKNFNGAAMGSAAIKGLKDSFNGFSSDPLGTINKGVMSGMKSVGNAMRGMGIGVQTPTGKPGTRAFNDASAMVSKNNNPTNTTINYTGKNNPDALKAKSKAFRPPGSAPAPAAPSVASPAPIAPSGGTLGTNDWLKTRKRYKS